jgi:hypothetical protein
MRYGTKTTTKVVTLGLALAVFATAALAQTGNQHHGKQLNANHPCPMNQAMGMTNGMGKHHNPNMRMGQDCSWCMGTMQDMSPERKKAFLDKTVDLRRQMMEKHFNYQEALRNPNPDKEKLNTLKKEMNDLRARIMQVRQEVVGH